MLSVVSASVGRCAVDGAIQVDGGKSSLEDTMGRVEEDLQHALPRCSQRRVSEWSEKGDAHFIDTNALKRRNRRHLRAMRAYRPHTHTDVHPDESDEAGVGPRRINRMPGRIHGRARVAKSLGH